jgi:hypothetical protein
MIVISKVYDQQDRYDLPRETRKVSTGFYHRTRGHEGIVSESFSTPEFQLKRPQYTAWHKHHDF